MRRVYLSFLGTSPYFECNYHQEGFEKIRGVRFVQEATVRWYSSTWSEQDSIVIFTTQEAFEKNWIDGNDKEGQHVAGLESCLRTMSLSPSIKNVNIPSGKDSDEIWRIFETVFNELRDGDHVYLDITHAFRSLPLLSLVILNYAKVTKDVKIEAISYGAMEAIGTAQVVRDMRPEERDVPVFDLLAYDQLLDWSTAIDRYTGTGDASMVSVLAEQGVRPVLRQTKGQDQQAQAVKLLAKNMEELSDAIATCRSKSIPLIAANLNCSLKDARQQEHVKPLSPLFEKLERQVSNFSCDEIKDGIAVAQWCIEHGLVQQGITIFLETMVSYVVREALGDDFHHKILRSLVNSALQIKTNSTPSEEWIAPACDYVDKVQALIKWFDEHPNIAKCFNNLIEPRNDINHAGQNDSPMKPDGFRKKLKVELERFRAATEI